MKFLSDILARAGLVVDGTVTLNSVANATTDTDRFIVVDSGVVKYRTGTQLLSDIGGISGNQTITLSGDATGSGTTSIAVTLANSGVTAGTYGSSTAVPVITVDAKGRVTGVTTASISGSLTFTGDVTGSGTTGTTTTLTLANSGVTAGTYTKVTVDAKGRVTTGATLSAGDIPSLSYLPLSGGTMTGDIIVGNGGNSANSNAFSTFTQIVFDNSHNDVARGPNKIVLHDNAGAWVGGFGIHADTVSYYTGGTHKWYKSTSQTAFTNIMSLDGSGNLTATSFIKSGGTSSQFLKADGSVDSTTYQSTSQKGQANGYASLDGAGKVPIAQLPSSIMEYKGTWNASTNSPSLADGTGDTGDVYRVSTAGTRNLGSGSITFDVGDYVIYNGTIWEKSDTTDAVASVNGLTGVITLTTTNIGEGTNLYYTDARARAAITLTTTGTSGAATYSGGVLNIPQYQSVLTNPVTGTGTTNYLSKFTGSTTIANSQIFDNATNVGIGTASPTYKLHVVGITNADDGFVNGQATFHKSVSLGNIGAGVTYTLGQLNFGSVYTHHFTVRVSSYAGTKVFNFIGYQASMSKLVSGIPYNQTRFDALDVIIESVTNVGGEFTGVKIGIKNGSAGEDYIYSATIECLSSFGGWTALASNTVLTPYSAGTSNYVVAQAGSVGVGTTSPTSKLNIVNGAATPGVKIEHSASGHAALWATTNEYGLLLQGTSTSSTFYLASISSGSVSRFYVRADGNIGIGTDTPSAKLVVNGTTWINQTTDYGGAASKVQISSGSISDNVVIRTNDLYLYNYGSSYSNLLRFGNGGETWNIGATSGTTPDFRLYEVNGASERLTIKAGGNVGIGTTAPTKKLHINTSANEGIFLQGTGGGVWMDIQVTGGNLHSIGAETVGMGVYNRTSSAYTFFITNAGNVGIGTKAPQTGVILDARGGAAVAGGSEGLRIGSVGDNSAYDNVKIYYTGYNSGAPRVYLTPRTTPGSGVVNTFLHLQNSNGSSTASNNTMGLLVDGSMGIGTVSPSAKLEINTPTAGYTGFTGSTVQGARINTLPGSGQSTALLLTQYLGDLSTDTTVDIDFAAVDSNSVLGSYPHARIGYTGGYNDGINTSPEYEARGYFRIATRGEGSGGVLADRLLIDYTGTLRLVNYTTNGFLKVSSSNGTVTVDTNTYLTSYTETDTLASVTGRGATTSTQVILNGGIRMGNAYLNPSGDLNHFHFNGTAIIPNTTTTASNASMGTASYRWSNLYGGGLDLSGSATISGNVTAAKYIVGSALGTSPIVVNTSANESQILLKKSSQSSFSVLTWDGNIFLASNIYYSAGAWVHDAPAGNNNNQLFVFTPGTGITWYASNNGSGSWNVANNITLWNDSGVWQRPVSSVSGTTNYISKFTSTTAVGNSQIFDNGTLVGIGATSAYIDSNDKFIVTGGRLAVNVGAFTPAAFNRSNGGAIVDLLIGGYGKGYIGSNGTDITLVSYANLLVTATSVGIGTSTPSRKLHVASSDWDNVTGSGVIFENSNTVGSGLTLKPTASVVTNGTSGWAIYAGGPGAAISDGNLGFWAHGTNEARLVIQRGGNVGIGTTSPLSTLHISGSDTGFRITGSSRAQMILANGISQWQIESPTGVSNTPAGSFGIIESGIGARFTILTGGSTGIGTTSPGTAKLYVRGQGTGGFNTIFEDNTSPYCWLQVKASGGGSNSSWQLGSYNNGFNFYNDNNSAYRVFFGDNGNVGIGTTTPGSILDASVSSGATSGFRFKGWSDAATPYLLSLGTQTYQDIFQIKSVNGLVTMGIVGAIGSTPDLVIQTNTTERIRITSLGNVYTAAGSAISYGSGETYQIWNSEPQFGIAHSDANWKDMKTFIPSKSGSLKFKFSAYISSGTYYWAWRIRLNGTSTVASGHYNLGLDTGEVTSVHAYRRFVASVGPIAAGDSLVLQMISSDGSGNPTTGNGQTLYAKEFRAYSTVPNVEHGGSSNIWGDYVGIGTASPLHKLHIIPNSSSDVVDALCIESNWGSISNHMVRFDGNVSGTGDGNVLLVRGGGTRTDTEIFEVQNGSGTQLFVRGDGKVGIGTTSISAKLHVVANSNQDGLFVSAADSSPFTAKIATFRYAANGNDICIEAQAGKAAIQARAGASTMDLLLNAAGGYVGIGTTAPATPLHVLGGPAGTGSWNKTATLAATYPGLIFNSNGTKWGGIAYDYSAGMRFWVNAGNDDIFATTAVVSVLNNGNVGIGTTTPTDPLHIAIPGADKFIKIENSTHYTGLWMNDSGTNNGWLLLSGFTTASSPGDFAIREYGVQTSLTIKQTTGNVGIGTTTPGYKLEVNGGATGNNIARFTTGGAGGGTRGLTIYSNDSHVKLQVTDNAGSASTWAHLGLNPDGGYVGVNTNSPANNLQIGSMGSTGYGGNHLAIGNGSGGAFAIWQETGRTNVYTSSFYSFQLSGSGTGNFVIGSTTDSALAKLQVSGAIQQTSVTSSLLKTNASGVLVAAVAGTDYLTPTSSTFTYDASLTLTTNWQNTGVTSANLTAKGVYVVSCYANDYSVGGSQYMCTYTGLMFWYTDGTNSSSTITEIPLHHSGHHDGGRYIYLRTVSSLNADGKTYLQIVGNGNNSGASTYSFTFKRLL